MPELPEVETVVRYVRPRLVGKRIASLSLPANYKRVLSGLTEHQAQKILKQQKITGVERRAKLIVLQLERGLVCIHLRMTGELLLDRPSTKDLKYVTAQFKFNDRSSLWFKDVRKFGKIHYYADPADFHRRYGVEPLSQAFTSQACHAALTSTKRQIKPLLLDQTVIAGIGNIYADEILWASKIHPQQNAATLSSQQCAEICRHTRRILKKSITLNGTTFKTFYFGASETGDFVNFLKVFDRTGQACPRCRTCIEKIRVAQRGTHFCPKCQKLKISRRK